MASGSYEIDNIALFPQPENHEWESDRDGVLGQDGDGKPFKKKYRQCVFRMGRRVDLHNWAQFDDGATHTITCPAPGGRADVWTDYTGCYVIVNTGQVREALAFDGVELIVLNAEGY
jgi:hypothetical protein